MGEIEENWRKIGGLKIQNKWEEIHQVGERTWDTEVTQGIQVDLMNADLMSRLVEVRPAVTSLPHTHGGSGELWRENQHRRYIFQRNYTQSTHY